MSGREEKGEDRRIVVVLGMHRSGTSAAIGLVEEQGVELGEVRRATRFQPGGNLENPRLIRFHESIIERAGGGWWDPPARVEPTPADRRRRDRILGDYPAGTIGIKEPRMLLLMGLWRELGPKRIGVIRNPVAVRRSLQARARERGRPAALLDDERCEALWRTYNEALLDEHDADPFPVIDFGRSAELPEAIRSALRLQGLEAPNEMRSLRPPETAPDEDWHSHVLAEPTRRLWERLEQVAGAWQRRLVGGPG
jgi:hypothetical protein